MNETSNADVKMSPPVVEDPVEQMLKRTGCIELHYKVQECIAETGDWRQCQETVKEFKVCMQKFTDSERDRLMRADP